MLSTKRELCQSDSLSNSYFCFHFDKFSQDSLPSVRYSFRVWGISNDCELQQNWTKMADILDVLDDRRSPPLSPIMN